MENEVKQRTQRNRRRERAQRMLAQKRENKGKNAADSGEDESPTREKPQRPPPPNRRKKSKDPPFEEDVIDGFAILSFRSYEDLENTIRLCGKGAAVTLGWEDNPSPKAEREAPLVNHVKPQTNNNNHQDNNDKNSQHHGHNNNNNSTNNNNNNNSNHNTIHDPGTSDDSCRERLTAPPRERESSHDRLSDASSLCSSGRGYICDSEGEDDKGSDAGSVLFTPTVRKHELPGCIPQSHHPPVLNNGTTGTGSPGRGVSTPSPPPQAPASVVVAPPKVPTPASPLRQNTPPPPPPPPPPPRAHHLPPPAPAPTIAHFPVTNGPLVGHPGLSNHPRLPTPPPAVPATLASQSPRTTTSAVSSTYPPPPSNYPLTAPQLSLPPAPNPAYLSPHPVVTTSYAPPPPSGSLAANSVYPPPHCTTGLSVTSNSNPVVVAAPSSYAASSTLPLSNYPPLYAPYNSTPYLSSMPASKSLVASQLNDFLHQRMDRMDRSPLPVISSKPADRPSGIVTTATAVVTTTTTTSHRDIVSTPLVGRSHSPRGHSPTRERDSYSNVSSLSRGSVTPVSCPPPPTNSSPFSAPVSAPSGTSSLPFNNKAPVWVGGSSGAQLSPANAVSRHPLSHSHPHPFPPPVFAPPVATAPSAASTIPAPPTANPNPFSAESLFQSNQADLLRRELDTRFLASQERTLVPPPYLRTEMHHHQHQHTHVHQHTAPLLPPPPPTLFNPPIFKDIPKLGGVDSPFYRQNLGLSSYPGFSPGLLHPTLGAATPFAPPNHLPTFTPKKTGKWNAMHVRIAWEIYHHQQKQAAEVKAGVSVAASSIPTKSELLRPPSHLFPAPPRPHDLSPFAAPHRAPHTAFESPAHPGASPFTSIGGSMFGRYPPAATAFPSLAAFPHGPLHDPWSRLQPRSATFPSSVTGPWSLKPEPGVTDAEREREREREREKERERSRERERCRREEKQRKLLAAQQNKVRERSPLREPPPAVPKEEEVILLGRPPPHYLQRHPSSRTLPPHFGPTPWDHPYRFDPLRFNPLMAAFRTEEEEQRAKLFGAYPPPPPHLRAKAPSPHRTGATLPHTHGHADLHKKEESSQSR